MQILAPVPESEVQLARGRWIDVLKALETLPDNMALPVELDIEKDAKILQAYIYTTQNRNGKLWKCRRSGATLFISKVR